MSVIMISHINFMASWYWFKNTMHF